jgi:hypothetical protein
MHTAAHNHFWQITTSATINGLYCVGNLLQKLDTESDALAESKRSSTCDEAVYQV